MDSKYGQIFTTDDVEKILDHLHKSAKLSSPPPPVENILEAMDDNDVQFRFPPEEPVFVLRGKDKRALGAIRYYSDHQSPRAPMNHLDGIDRAVDNFERYRVDHANQMKEPD